MVYLISLFDTISLARNLYYIAKLQFYTCRKPCSQVTFNRKKKMFGLFQSSGNETYKHQFKLFLNGDLIILDPKEICFKS